MAKGRYVPISDNKLRHMRAVAETMRDTALANGMTDDEADGMYLLGLVHDIGYIHGAKGHSDTGADILENAGYPLAQAVRDHGSPREDPPRELVMLWHADMTCDSVGRRIPYDGRLADIVRRYGRDSSQAQNATLIVGFLRSQSDITLV